VIGGSGGCILFFHWMGSAVGSTVVGTVLILNCKDNEVSAVHLTKSASVVQQAAGYTAAALHKSRLQFRKISR
jgi:hypothetical protein